ncbi:MULTISPECIES: hypothetical protein [Comamonas]|jgi:hypothetical protein|uniref:hypothetical protein n=1 Tax=Comamonas TaxID=283 RepID=UPI00257EE2F5|nr:MULTISPECIES: hypothetical protein [Comamonas]
MKKGLQIEKHLKSLFFERWQLLFYPPQKAKPLLAQAPTAAGNWRGPRLVCL